MPATHVPPNPRPNEVLVKVSAASVSPVDYKTREGQYLVVTAEQLPVILGRDIAGTVERCGSAVTRFRPGDAVYALLDRNHGGYAEYVLVKERDLAPKPKDVNFIEAAAVPLAAITAWQGLFDHGHLREGQHVLIHGGAGGVGRLAIQCAKARGTHVTTTASEENLDFVRSIGADQAIDKTRPFEDLIDPVDLVFDLVDGEMQERSWKVLKQGGGIISTLKQPSPQQAAAHSAHAEHYMAQINGLQLRDITQLIDSGQLRPHVDAVFRLLDAGGAQRQLENHHNRGKIVLRTD